MNKIRIRKQKINKLKKQAEELKNKINSQRKNNVKNICIKNLKIFGSTCNFAMPFVITAGIGVGIFKICNGGLPFIRDDVTKYKRYSLEYQTATKCQTNEIYQTHHWYSDQLPSNKLKISTPWQKNEDGTFSRTNREYSFDNVNFKELYYAILNENIEYLNNILNNYNEEIETISNIDNISDEYIIEASLNSLDKNDTLKYPESNTKNIIITIIEMLITMLIGSFATYKRSFKIVYSINNINEKYKIVSIKPLKQELNNIEQKILSLSKASIK